MQRTEPIYVLGIYNGHNATAALLKDGEIIAAVSEERFVGVKNFHGFPKKSIDWCLSYAKISGKDLALVALPFNTEVPIYIEDGKSKDSSVTVLTFFYKFASIVRRFWGKIVYRYAYLRPIGQYVYIVIAKIVGPYGTKKQKQFIARTLNIPIEKVVSFDHHLSHAVSAYYSSPFNKEKALVFTLDAEGDGLCSTVNIFNKDSIERIGYTRKDSSIGRVYALVTKYLGMKMGEHEYKVMGLAPYAKANDVLKLFKKINNIITLHARNKLTFTSQFNTQDTLFFLRKDMQNIRFDIIAGSFQKLLEDRIREWIDFATKKRGITTVICSGGVFMNVKANQRVVSLPRVKKAYFMPSAGDESTPIGTCFLACQDIYRAQNSAASIKPLKDLYLGPSFSDTYIEDFFKKRNYNKKYKIRKIPYIEKKVANLLSRGEVVARMSGRMEFGARALGNRSILADPSRLEVIRIINEQIKSRDFWMPFAPTILYERMSNYCINPKNIEASYMTVSFDSTQLAREHLKAAMHPYDFTLRPQILRKEANKSYYTLIKEFERLTGIGAVLNTSFNLHGYPVVLGPKEALYVFEHSGIRYLALEHFLIEKSLHG